MRNSAADDVVETSDEVAVVFTCAWCRKTVLVRSSSGRDELAGAAAFVRDHEECLRRSRLEH